jgi:hypothetical protein
MQYQPDEYLAGEEYNEEYARIGEPISVTNMAIALPLINIFGEQPVRMLFSRTWTLREKAIQMIESEIIKGIMHPADGIIFGLIVVKLSISDKIVGVS